MKRLSSAKSLACFASFLVLVFCAVLYPFLFSPYIEVPLYPASDMPSGLEGLLLRTRIFLLENTVWSELQGESIIPSIDLNIPRASGLYSYGREYRFGSDVYSVLPVSGVWEKGEEMPMYSFIKNGKTLATVPMCYGADFPVYESRLVDGKLALSYLQGHCQNAHQATFYDDRIFVTNNHTDVAHIFSYRDQLGFINDTPFAGKVVVFNGKVVSDIFDNIPTHVCCMPEFLPRFDVYEDRTLVFIGERGGQSFLVRTRLQ